MTTTDFIKQFTKDEILEVLNVLITSGYVRGEIAQELYRIRSQELLDQLEKTGSKLNHALDMMVNPGANSGYWYAEWQRLNAEWNKINKKIDRLDKSLAGLKDKE